MVHNARIRYNGTHMFDGDSNFYTWYEITHMVDYGAQQLQLVQTSARVDF